MADQDLVDVDPNDPGDGSIPVLRWKRAGTGARTARAAAIAETGKRAVAMSVVRSLTSHWVSWALAVECRRPSSPGFW